MIGHTFYGPYSIRLPQMININTFRPLNFYQDGKRLSTSITKNVSGTNHLPLKQKNERTRL